MYVITKDFAFSAAHQLVDLSPDHPCGRLHGHNYAVRVEMSAVTLRDEGWVADYAVLDDFGEWLDERVDHRNLNEVVWPDGLQTTAENLAHFFYDTLVSMGLYEVSAVGVSETPKTWAWYRP